ncbi:hypothetical protein WJX74_009728 [Apatococcus lobatus]|uniref:Uncharacterized protein n=1 Tax=Apatococcus lobatus TaxID=904363 RepID=A0AAW1Q5M3_9CHLO
MSTGQELTGLLFSEARVTGPRGFGYFRNADPNWFVWREHEVSPVDALVHKALFSPLITVWHLVAKSHPTGKWRYRGAFAREMAFSASQRGPVNGLLLRRLPAADMADPHLSLDEPLRLHLEYAAPVAPTSLGRARHSMVEMFNHVHGGDSSIVWSLQWFLEASNVLVWDHAIGRMGSSPLLDNLLIGPARPQDHGTPSPDGDDARLRRFLRAPVARHTEEAMWARWDALPHDIDPALACHSDDETL